MKQTSEGKRTRTDGSGFSAWAIASTMVLIVGGSILPPAAANAADTNVPGCDALAVPCDSVKTPGKGDLPTSCSDLTAQSGADVCTDPLAFICEVLDQSGADACNDPLALVCDVLDFDGNGDCLPPTTCGECDPDSLQEQICNQLDTDQTGDCLPPGVEPEGVDPSTLIEALCRIADTDGDGDCQEPPGIAGILGELVAEPACVTSETCFGGDDEASGGCPGWWAAWEVEGQYQANGALLGGGSGAANVYMACGDGVPLVDCDVSASKIECHEGPKQSKKGDRGCGITITEEGDFEVRVKCIDPVYPGLGQELLYRVTGYNVTLIESWPA